MLKDERPRGPGTVRPFVFRETTSPPVQLDVGFEQRLEPRTFRSAAAIDRSIMAVAVEPSMGAVRALSLAVLVARWLRGLEARARQLVVENGAKAVISTTRTPAA